MRVSMRAHRLPPSMLLSKVRAINLDRILCTAKQLRRLRVRQERFANRRRAKDEERARALIVWRKRAVYSRIDAFELVL